MVVISLETPDGGKAGVPTEVSRRNAARLIVEGWAELANADEIGQLSGRAERGENGGR